MWKFKSPVLMSFAAAVVLSGAIGGVLYVFSSKFFVAKNNQTVLKASELGRSKTDVVLAVGQAVPALSFDGIKSQKKYDLAKDSKVKILNFWASWCEPCAEEFSSFARLMQKLDGKVSFVALSEDRTLEEASEFLEAFSIDFKNLKSVHFGFDHQKSFSKNYGVLALPETFIVDKKGALVKRVTGFENWDTPEVLNFFEALIGKAEK